MNLSRSSIFVVLMLALGLLLFHQGAPLARSAESSSTATVVPASAPGDAKPAKKTGLVDANSVFFGCAAGTAVGALGVALPPLVGWTFYAGALPAVVAMLVTSGVGCTVGLFGGVVLSTFYWIFSKIGAAWSAVFG